MAVPVVNAVKLTAQAARLWPSVSNAAVAVAVVADVMSVAVEAICTRSSARPSLLCVRGISNSLYFVLLIWKLAVAVAGVLDRVYDTRR